MILPPGTRLGPYEIRGSLGSGSMGVVYKAHDSKLQRSVAIKLLTKRDVSASSMLLEEARAASAVNHPNICTIHDVCEDDGQAFIVMEHVEGQALNRLIPRGGLAAESVLRYATQVADALACAHDRGVLHRDLKSQNVIITPEGRVKVVDFGVAARLPESDVDAVTRTQPSRLLAGTIAGTLPYMAPEVLRGEAATKQSDIWALGILLHEMATGTLPFMSVSSADLVAAILKDSLTALPEHVAPGLRVVIYRCLAKERAHRYGSAGEVRAALEAVQTGSHRAVSSGASSVRAAPSIVVLPFSNLSSDPEQEYFCDGIAEEIINALAKAKLLRVVARTSAFAFKGQHQDIRKIGALLAVDHVVEGSVRKSGDRLRIAVQLIGVADGFPIWSERFERGLADVFAIQDEIALAIVERLEVELLGGERERLLKRSTDRVDLYNLLLLARFHWNRFTAEGARRCQESLEQALKLDPTYAPAHAAMAQLHLQLGPAGGRMPAAVVAPKARASAYQALSLDPTNGEAHSALAVGSVFYDRDWPAARHHSLQAVALEANAPMSHQAYAFYLTAAGRHQSAVQEVERAVELDPIAPLFLETAAWAYYHARDFTRARSYCDRCLELDPHFGWAHLVKGMVECQARSFDAAIRSFETAGIPTAADAYLAFACGAAGHSERARTILRELQGRRDREVVSAYYLALIHAGLGERESAVTWLATAAEERPAETVFTAWLTSDVIWDEFRQIPDAQSAFGRMKLSE